MVLLINSKKTWGISTMAHINKIGHIVLYVTDVQKSVAFYRDMLGMETIRCDYHQGTAFMSFGTQHHDVALVRAQAAFKRYKHSMVDGYYAPTRGTLGLAHIAMQVDGGINNLKKFHDHLVDNQISVRLSDHGMIQSVYFLDPDYNEIELFIETMTPIEGKQYMSEDHDVAPLTFDVMEGSSIGG